jgi:signal transduction histidine kinase/ligand-binding sensor domain-containing protein
MPAKRRTGGTLHRMRGRVPKRGDCAGIAPLIVASALAVLVGRESAAALPENLIVERLGEERGFPSATITALYRDRAGFLWVGSREGLAVWDGYSIRTFEHEVGNAASLPDNSIRVLYEDREGRLWVGTNTGGLARLDRATGRFDVMRHDPADPTSLSHDSVYAIAECPDRSLWVGTQEGLNRLDPATGKFERLRARASDASTLPHDYVYALKLDRQGRLWIATVGGGVAWIDPATRRVTRVPFARDPGAPEPDRLMFAIAEDAAGTLWFGSQGDLYRFDAADGALHHVPVAELAPGKDVPIITSIAVEARGVLWVSTWNRGLVAYDPGSRASRGYRHDVARTESLAADRLSCVLIDTAGDAWAGTWGSGINRFSTGGDLFSAILEKDPGSTGGLAYREVTSLLDDRSGGLWVGTWGKGLSRRDPHGTEFAGIAAPPDPPLALNTVLALAEQGDGAVWAGSMIGLFRIDARSGKATVSARAPQDPRGLGPGYVNAVLVDRSGTLWVGTGGGGLNRLEPDGRSFKRFHSDPADAASLSDDFVTAVLEGTDGTLWVGTRSGGLNAFDPKTSRSVRFLPSPSNPATIGHHHVTAILESKRGTIWVGTDGGGMARLEKDGTAGWSVKRVTTDDGLVNQNVASLLADDDGSLWVGTRHGLSRYDPASGRFHNYGLGDGLPSNEFSPGAASRGKDGLHFGTSRGLLVIRPGTTFVEPAVAPTQITDIRTLAGPLHLVATPWETEALEVPYGTPLLFAFSVLDFRSPHRFAYRLQGKSESWTELGASREIAFTDLPPGRYTMNVRGRSAVGAWSETRVPLRIRVTPRFWMTWWFRVGGAIAVLGLVSTAFRARMRSLERRNRELLSLQAAREKALLEARASQEALHGAYGRLRALTRQLEDAKEEEKRRIARELHDEMGQLLSAIKIDLKALRRLPALSDERGGRIADAIALVDSMIGHVRAMALDLRPPLLDELGLVPAVRGYAEGQSVRTGVAIGVEANAGAETLRPDTAIAAFRIVQEAVSNTLRHASAGRITVSVRTDEKRLLLSVRDDGRGFDVAEALRRAATGRHLGLLGMRERVEALGGRLEIDSAPGQGTEIRASVPSDEEGAS